MSTCVCDVFAFHPISRLVNGPLEDLSDLIAAESFVRAAVLHDEMILELEPFKHIPGRGFTRFEIELLSEMSVILETREISPGRYTILSGGPALKGFEMLMVDSSKEPVPEIELSPELMAVSEWAAEGIPEVEAHVRYLKRMVARLRQGGSLLLCGGFGGRAFEVAERYPGVLFKNLDETWQRYAQESLSDGLGLLIPPVLGIVLSRAAKREAIPGILGDLRNEWADARRKVWMLLDALKGSHSLEEATSIRNELSRSSKLFSPEETEADSHPVRILWELLAAGAVGAGIATFSGGKPLVGAIAGALTQAARAVPGFVHEFGRVMFGRGAFDLARRVSRELRKVDLQALPRLLSAAEKENLGLS